MSTPPVQTSSPQRQTQPPGRGSPGPIRARGSPRGGPRGGGPPRRGSVLNTRGAPRNGSPHRGAPRGTLQRTHTYPREEKEEQPVVKPVVASTPDPDREKKRLFVVRELVDTENTYSKSLNVLVEVFSKN